MEPPLEEAGRNKDFSCLPQKFHELRIEELHYVSA
jgi:hypothetical protein